MRHRLAEPVQQRKVRRVVDDLSHLIPTRETIEKSAMESVETSLFKQLLMKLGVDGKAVKKAMRKDGRITSSWFGAEFPDFPFEIDATRIKSCFVQEFFERPTKTAAFESFVKAFPEHKTRPSALMFKAEGFTALVIFTSPAMGEGVGVALRFNVRGVPYYVSTLKEFADAYRERCGPLDS